MDEDIFKELDEDKNDIKEVIELESEEIAVEDDVVMEKNRKGRKGKKEKKPSWFSKLPKKKKIIIISIIVVVLLIIIGLLLYFFVFSKSETKDKIEEVNIVVEKNNYRYENGVLVFLDSNDKEIGKYECTNKDQNLCLIASYSIEENLYTSKYINEEGEEINFDTPVFSNRYVIVYDNENLDNENLTLYDLELNKSLGVYQSVKRYDDKNIYLVDENGKYGLINLEGEEPLTKIAFEYNYLGNNIGSSKIAYKLDDKSGLLNIDGTKFKENLSGTIYSYDDNGLVVLETNGSYKISGLTNTDVLKDSYSFMYIEEGYIYYVDNNMLYVRLDNGSKLYEEGIEILEGTVFDNVITYDESYKLIKSEYFIEAIVETGSLEFTMNDEEYSYNKYEALINNNYNYVNYFDKKLYIYSDAAKEEDYKIYTCENENTVDESDASFDNCFIATESKLLNRTNAKDTLGFIPIYGNKYIFINDMKPKSTSANIKLWDLDKPDAEYPIATYKSVDIGYYNDSNDIISADASNLIIMAQNLNKYYGLIKLNNTSVESLFGTEFIYSTIQLANDVYYTKDKDGNYRIFNKSGTEITNSEIEIKNEIVDYNGNYLKVKSGTGKYLVYKNDGTIVSNELANIKLGTDKYLGVTSDDKIEVYNYSNGKTNILSVTVPLLSSDITFVDNTTAGFEIIFKDSEQKVIGTYSFKHNGEEV